MSSFAFAGAAHVQTVNNNKTSASTNAVAFGSNNTAGNLIVCGVTVGDDNTVTATIADTRSNSYSLVSGPDNQSQSGNLFRQYFWYAKNIAAGANTVTATFSTAKWSVFICSEFSGLDTTAPLDTGLTVWFARRSGSANTAFSVAATGTTANANDLIIGYGGDMWTASGTITAGASFTIPTNGNANSASNGQYAFLEYKSVAATGTQTCTATLGNSSFWAGYCVAFKEADATRRRNAVAID